MAEADTATDWVAGLSPWPTEFGLERMHALLAELGNPQLAYESIHVVGTNGKSTTTRTIEALLAAEGLSVGAYLSPHVLRWAERIRIDGSEADFEAAVAAVREPSERLSATQFETLTAAALTAFAEAAVDVAVVEAGLGGRLDATNVLRSRVQVLTNVALDHTEVLGETRPEIAAEKLAVVQRGSTVVIGEPEWEPLARANGAARVVVGGAREAAEAFLGRRVERSIEVLLPGRLERRDGEIWDGAHNVAGVDWLLDRLPATEYVVCASILADKQPEAMLERLATVGRTLVATASTNARTVSPDDLAAIASRYFEHVEAIADPAAALDRARDLAVEERQVLVTGSLYLLADLSANEREASRCTALASG